MAHSLRLTALLFLAVSAGAAFAQDTASTSKSGVAAADTGAPKAAGNQPSQIPNLMKNGMGNGQSPALPAGQETGTGRSTTNN